MVFKNIKRYNITHKSNPIIFKSNIFQKEKKTRNKSDIKEKSCAKKSIYIDIWKCVVNQINKTNI